MKILIWFTLKFGVSLVYLIQLDVNTFTFIDDYLQNTFCVFIENRSENAHMIELFIAWVEKQFSTKIKIIQLDNA